MDWYRREQRTVRWEDVYKAAPGQLTGIQRAILGCVALQCKNNRSGITWKGIRYIARHSRFSKSTVADTLKALVKMGLLDREARPGKSAAYRMGYKFFEHKRAKRW